MSINGKPCCVPECFSDTVTNKNISFHLFPKDKKIRHVWIQRVKRCYDNKYTLSKHWKPRKFDIICGLHFNKSGKKLFNDKYPIYFPHITYLDPFMINNLQENSSHSPDVVQNEVKLPPENSKSVEDKFGGACKLQKHIDCDSVGSRQLNNISVVSKGKQVHQCDDTKITEKRLRNINLDHSYAISLLSQEQATCTINDLKKERMKLEEKLAECNSIMTTLEEKVKVLQFHVKEKNKQLRDRQIKIPSGVKEKNPCIADVILNNEKMLKFHTGFPSKKCFETFLKIISSDYEATKSDKLYDGRPNKLNFYQEAVLVFCRLRLGLPETDLAYRFNISRGTVDNIIRFWLNLLYYIFNSADIWPSKSVVMKNMPYLFKENFPNTRVIIDCMEICIEDPCDVNIQSKNFSSYKAHNTAKGLVAVSPHGSVSFISKLFPGIRTSDKQLFARCGLKELLEPGDSVMADKGFLICEDLAKIGVTLDNSPFLNADCGQFGIYDFNSGDSITNVRLYIERVFSEIKNFRILKHVFPNSAHDSLNQIWKICCHMQLFIHEHFFQRNENFPP